MTPIVAQCPSCKKRFKIKNAKLAGRKLKCSNCQTAFRVQGPAAAAVVARKSAKETADVWGDDAGDDSFEDDFAAPPPKPARRPAKKKRRPKDEATRPRAEGRRRVRDEDESDTNRNMAAIVAGGSILALLLLGGIGFVLQKMVTGGSVEVPTEFVEYIPKEKSFMCEYPSEWDAQGSGGSGGRTAWATFEKGSAYISIRDSFVGQTMGDISRTVDNQAVQAGFEPEPPAVAIHEEKRPIVADTMNNYDEGPAQVIHCGYGEGRISEFTARSTFGGKLCGLRATFWSPQNQLNVICKCHESHFEALKPSFVRVIESIGPGGGRNRR